jgi:hypothetical protein
MAINRQRQKTGISMTKKLTHVSLDAMMRSGADSVRRSSKLRLDAMMRAEQTVLVLNANSGNINLSEYVYKTVYLSI